MDPGSSEGAVSVPWVPPGQGAQGQLPCTTPSSGCSSSWQDLPKPCSLLEWLLSSPPVGKGLAPQPALQPRQPCRALCCHHPGSHSAACVLPWDQTHGAKLWHGHIPAARPWHLAGAWHVALQPDPDCMTWGGVNTQIHGPTAPSWAGSGGPNQGGTHQALGRLQPCSRRLKRDDQRGQCSPGESPGGPWAGAATSTPDKCGQPLLGEGRKLRGPGGLGSPTGTLEL